MNPGGALLAGDTVFSVWSPPAFSDKKSALYRVLADRVLIGGAGEIREEQGGSFSLLLTSESSAFLDSSIPSEEQGYHFLRIHGSDPAEQILASKHAFSLNAFARLGADPYWFEQRDVGMLELKTTVRRSGVRASVELDGQAWLGGLRLCEDATREGVAPVKSRGIVRFPLP